MFKFSQCTRHLRCRVRALSLPRLILSAVLLLLFILLIFAALNPRGSIYTLDIETEVVSLVVGDPRFSQWTLAGSSLTVDPFESDKIILDKEAVLLLNSGVNAEILRYGVGDVFVRLECEGGSVGDVDNGRFSSIELGEWALLQFELKEKPLVLSFRGYLSIGEDVASQVDSLLLGGTVSIIEEKFASHGHYTAGGESLDAGDRVRLWSRDIDKHGEIAEKTLGESDCSGGERLLLSERDAGRVSSRMDGFIRAEPASFSEAENALRMIAHGEADYARVERLGSGGYEIRAPFFHRFLHDPILAAMLAGLTLLALFIELGIKIWERR